MYIHVIAWANFASYVLYVFLILLFDHTVYRILDFANGDERILQVKYWSTQWLPKFSPLPHGDWL